MNAQDRVSAYAEAFHEAAVERWTATLDEVAAKLSQDGSLADRLQATGVEFDRRQGLLDSILPTGIDPLLRNLLYSLVERGDLGLLAGLAGALRQRLVQRKVELIPVEVVSAVPLTDAQRHDLIAKLQAQYGAGLDVRYMVDPAILGGLIVRVGDRLIDGSLATRMAAMRQAVGVGTTG